MSTPGITRNMLDCMRVIQELSAGGVPPSFGEIASELGLKSKASVASVVADLVDRGYLARRPGQARSLSVLVPVPMAEEPEIAGLFDAGVAVAPRIIEDLVNLTAQALAEGARDGTA